MKEAWRNAWVPGSVLVCDESMAAWEGATQAHLTLIPRKPTPLGFMFKVMNDASSRIMLDFEAVEGKAIDQLKAFVERFGATTACTLRLVQKWGGKGYIVVADSWFGSTRTAEELAEIGCYAVLSIKRGCKDYPKKEILQQMKTRGDVAYYVDEFKLGESGEGEQMKLIACGHMDKKPLLLAATCGTSLPGPDRQRHYARYKEGRYQVDNYTLQQPDVFSIYRDNFATCDTFNKVALGPKSVMNTVKVKLWSKRVM